MISDLDIIKTDKTKGSSYYGVHYLVYYNENSLLREINNSCFGELLKILVVNLNKNESLRLRILCPFGDTYRKFLVIKYISKIFKSFFDEISIGVIGKNIFVDIILTKESYYDALLSYLSWIRLAWEEYSYWSESKSKRILDWIYLALEEGHSGHIPILFLSSTSTAGKKWYDISLEEARNRIKILLKLIKESGVFSTQIKNLRYSEQLYEIFEGNTRYYPKIQEKSFRAVNQFLRENYVSS